MKLRYVGPEGQSNPEIGQETGDGDFLEAGKIYELSPELGERALASGEHFKRVRDYDELTEEQLQSIAAEHEIDGRSKMTKKQLVNAVRKAES